MAAYGTYLYRREGTYYFRLSIPMEYRGIFGYCELRRSLDTGNRRRAQAMARRAAFELRNLFFTLDGPNMAKKPTTQEIKHAVDAVFRRLLHDSEQELALAPMKLPSALDDEIDDLECDLKLAQEVLAMGGNEAAATWARNIAQKQGWVTGDDSPEFATLCRELLKRMVDRYRVEIARSKGGYTLEGQLFPPEAVTPVPTPSSRARPEGKQLGRTKGLGKSRLDGKSRDIEQFLQKGVSKASIAKIVEVAPATLQHFLKTRRLG